jgi:photosystem II stability/assembly factor-like uncharacterized protein
MPKCVFLVLLVVSVIAPRHSLADEWTFLGPEGGDARKLAFDPQNPNRILLGTNAGALFASDDGGRSWFFRAQIGDRQDYVLDDIVFDPRESRIVYIAAWSVEQKGRGGVFKSMDGGYNWRVLRPMEAKSVRALVLSPSAPRIVLAGTLEGVFRSDDAGNSWHAISQNREGPGNVGALAVHPANPDVMFAGTFHLPWRTKNGGRTWSLIRSGLIDDSDIFSIFIDPRNPDVVFASACSGIYKSSDGGTHFRKLRGIPFSARRTRVIRQHPSNSSIVYAGTTEGLWRTLNGGFTWSRLTDRNLVVNDVLIDPRNTNHLLVAADRIGILASHDGGMTFHPSNRGFFHRQVRTFAIGTSPNTLYAADTNGREFGGVFGTHDGGLTWKQINNGLAGREVFTLQFGSQGMPIAGTQNGVFILDPSTLTWRATGTLAVTNQRVLRTPRLQEKSIEASIGRVLQLLTNLSNGSERWHAATAEGVFSSLDQGHNWAGGPVATEKMFTTLDVNGKSILAATPTHLFLSSDESRWEELSIPQGSPPLTKVFFGPGSTIWLVTRLGVFRSSNVGKTWQPITARERTENFSYVVFDRICRCLLALDASRTGIFESFDSGDTWALLAQSPRPLRSVETRDQKLIAVTDFDGLIARPVVVRHSTATVGSSPLR